MAEFLATQQTTKQRISKMETELKEFQSYYDTSSISTAASIPATPEPTTPRVKVTSDDTQVKSPYAPRPRLKKNT